MEEKREESRKDDAPSTGRSTPTREEETGTPNNVRLANSKAGIKPTAPLSVFDKENSIEFLLDSLHYLYNYYIVCALLSHTYYVTYHVTLFDITL